MHFWALLTDVNNILIRFVGVSLRPLLTLSLSRAFSLSPPKHPHIIVNTYIQQILFGSPPSTSTCTPPIYGNGVALPSKRSDSLVAWPVAVSQAMWVSWLLACHVALVRTGLLAGSRTVETSTAHMYRHSGHNTNFFLKGHHGWRSGDS
jgi:hypothetical protein